MGVDMTALPYVCAVKNFKDVSVGEVIQVSQHLAAELIADNLVVACDSQSDELTDRERDLYLRVRDL